MTSSFALRSAGLVLAAQLCVSCGGEGSLEHSARQGALLIAPSWGDAKGLCPGERFSVQPAAAFCSGVLVDWDLVLTAGHCARVYALGDFVVAFDYFYQAPGELALVDLREPVELVAEALDPAGTEPRLDY